MRILAHFTAYKSCVKIWIFTSSSDVYLEKPELIWTNIDPLGSIKKSKIRLKILLYRIYSFKTRPQLSAASESKNINKRRIYSHNAALNQSTIRLSWITGEKTSTAQLNLNESGKFIFLYCNVFQFEMSISHCSLTFLLLIFAYRITSFTNIMIFNKRRTRINAASETPKKINKRRGA